MSREGGEQLPSKYDGTERYQGKEMRATLRANTRDKLEQMLAELQVYATEQEMTEVEILKGPVRDPDGGWEVVVDTHNLNILSWAKEHWEARGGGLEARIKREQETREKQLKESKLRAEASKEKARQERERSLSEAERAKSEKELAELSVGTRKSIQERREAARKRRRDELAMRLETFEEGVRQVGGFAGAQVATFETALYTPSLFVEEATTPVRPRRPQRPLQQDIFDTRLPY